jgi:DhnA family fructose-bisphosphate aldolase class Ia
MKQTTQPGDIPFRSLEDYREQIRQVIRQGVVDIVLMSASTCEQLVLKERMFDDSHVTPAVRANDATDIHVMRGSQLGSQPSLPFRTASLDHAQCGHIDCASAERSLGVDLGLYSITFNNDSRLDREALEAYKAFREEAEVKGFRHFLEVFHPNAPINLDPAKTADFVNDAIARSLAGVTSKGRPLFLKIPYPGPRAMEELVAYDPHLVVGILGGSSGTTRDAFQLIHDARKHGARVALFGRKINNAENQLAFIEFLRLIVDDVIEPEEAVRAYHAVLAKLKIKPQRSLDEDLRQTTGVASYSQQPAGGRGASALEARESTGGAIPPHKMTPEERLAYHRERLKRILGG